MNRNQRRLGRQHQKRYEETKYVKAELEEVLPPKSKRDPAKLKKFTTHKCCFVTPVYEDFGQITEAHETPVKYQDILKDQFGFDPLMPETINQLKELRKVLCNSIAKVENSSQYADDTNRRSPEFANIDGTQWQTVDSVAEIDKYIAHKKVSGKLETYIFLPENVRITETPRIKIIAKKFSKCKRNNIELRRLDEKVACVEYDVFIGDEKKPRETLRAFFSIKPGNGKKDSEKEAKFNMTNDELKKFTEKEIEIIDGKIRENKSYLDDLKRILRRKQAVYEKRNKNTLDLMSLYEMAKRESPPLEDGFSSANFLSKAELQEMKNLILKKCASSAHGINRRTLKKEPAANDGDQGLISQSIVAELWREGETVVK